MGVSENVVYPFLPNGFADQTIPMKNCYFIGKINPTFSDKPSLFIGGSANFASNYIELF